MSTQPGGGLCAEIGALDRRNMESVVCNVCGNETTLELFRKWEFAIVQCTCCGLVYVNPRTLTIECEEYFRGPYLETIEERGRICPGIAHIYQEALRRLEEFVKPGSLLDVGCAMGHFMDVARARGWEVEGTEPSPYAAQCARDRFHVKVHTVAALSDAHLPPERFDAVVMIEVVEHLPDPSRTLAETFRVLKPGGLVYCTTPNFASYQSMLTRQEWGPIIPTGHLFYFASATLSGLMRKCGFEEVFEFTEPADWGNELASATQSGKIRLSPSQVAHLERTIARQERGVAQNGRSESLVICARKPQSCLHRRPWEMDLTAVAHRWEGDLIRRQGDCPDDQKVYLVRDGKKRWVIRREWLVEQGYDWPGDVRIIPADDLEAIPAGDPIG